MDQRETRVAIGRRFALNLDGWTLPGAAPSRGGHLGGVRTLVAPVVEERLLSAVAPLGTQYSVLSTQCAARNPVPERAVAGAIDRSSN